MASSPLAQDRPAAASHLPNRRELIVLLALLNVALWGGMLVNASTPTVYLRSGQVKGPDFVQFYALAHLAADGRASDFSSPVALREAQLSTVPESSAKIYPPLYGPQIAVALSPLGHVSYRRALRIWLIITAVIYFLLVADIVRRETHLQAARPVVLMGAAAFPPFWQLIQHGQLAVVALIAIVLAWHGLRTRHTIVAGIALGLLGYKPSLIAPALLILAFGGEWKMLGAAGITAVFQLLLAIPWVGVQGTVDYLAMLAQLPGMANTLATKPENMLSLRTFWTLIVGSGVTGNLLYGASAIVAIVAAGRTWRRLGSASLRMAVLAIGTVLAAPHLFVYDSVILAPAWLWLAEWWLDGDAPRSVATLLIAGFLAPLFSPVAQYLHIQVATVCFAALLFVLSRTQERDGDRSIRSEARAAAAALAIS